MMKSAYKKAIVAITIIATTAVIVPFDLIVAPERRFIVVNADGMPIQGVRARRTWDQYSLGISGKDEKVSADNGQVFLPSITVKANLLFLVVGAAYQFFEYRIHASYRSTDDIVLDRGGYQKKGVYMGKGLERGVIVLEGEKKIMQ